VLSRNSVGQGQDWFGVRNTRLIQFGSFTRAWGSKGGTGDRLLCRVVEVGSRFWGGRVN
jgi:hypothetical protein